MFGLIISTEHVLVLEKYAGSKFDLIGFSSKRPTDPHKWKLASRFLLREFSDQLLFNLCKTGCGP